MRVICAWCHRDLGSVQANPAYGGRITHGICGTCREAHDPLVSIGPWG